MNVKVLLQDHDFFTGVPDSQLKALCNALMDTHGINKNHIIAANEGNAVALAAGYYLATGNIPVVYLQNSGIGNIINPVASLLNDKIYGIPCLFIVGWRGEPGIHDEPQHVFQGAVTEKLLKSMDIDTFVLSSETTEESLVAQMKTWESRFSQGKSAAIIVRKNALSDTESRPLEYKNHYTLLREDIIRAITDVSEEDVIVSTTGKASRELFEIRELKNQAHNTDFLTVGSMGHSSSIALGIALQKPDKKIWCIDGDGAALMHLGAFATMGAQSPANLVHVLINNISHETVGGMPTVAEKIDFVGIAKACGYSEAVSVDDESVLKSVLKKAKTTNHLTFIEVKAQIGSRKDLGRPTISSIENKKRFMEFLIDKDRNK